MKKIVVVSSLAIVIAGGAAAVPYYSGDKVEASINTAQTLQRGAAGLDFEPNSYNRGYLKSTADSTLALTIEGEVMKFAVEHEIEHMLVPRVRSTFRLLPEGGEVQQAIHDFYGDQPVLFMDTRLTTGGTEIAVTMPEVEGLLADERTRLNFGGLSGNLHYNGSDASGHIDVLPVRMEDGDKRLVVSGQKLDFETSEVDQLLSPGTMSYLLERVEFSDAGEAVALDTLRISSSQSVDASVVGGEMRLEIDALETPKGRVDDISASMVINNFHRELMEFLVELEANGAEDLEDFSVAPEIFEPMLVRFLEGTPGANMDFVLGPSADSKVAIDWDMLYSKPEALEIDLNEPMNLIAGIDTTVLLTFKPEFIDEFAQLTEGALGTVEDINAMLGMMEAEGYLTRDDKGYRVKLGFKGGNFLVNDVPRPELMMMLAMLAME